MIIQKPWFQRILRGPDDMSDLEQPFDESVLDDPEKMAAAAGSNFKGSDDPDDTPDDRTRDPDARAAKVDKKDEPVKEEPKKEEPKKEPVKEEPKDDPKDDPKDEKGAIPLARHKEILDRVRAERDEAVRAVANAQGGAKVVQANQVLVNLEIKVEGLQEKYDAAIIDGDKDLAKTLAKDMRAAERELGDKKTEIAVAIARAEAIESTRFDMARERIEGAYAVLNPDHDDFDQKTMDEVLELKDAYQLKGYTATDAMQKAVRVLLGAKTTAQETTTTVAPRVDESVVDVGKTRKENAVDKALKTQQPPSTARVGIDQDRLGKSRTARDVMKMTDKEFNDLSDDELAAMRGDQRLVEENEDR